MKQIKITITPEGETKIEASGYAGDECIKATAPLERALGVPEGARTRKPESLTVAADVHQFTKGGGK